MAIAPEDPVAPPSRPSASSGFSASPGHALRRAKTIDETQPRRSRSLASPLEGPSDLPPRRGSSLSDYSNEARDILNPKARPGSEAALPETSSLAVVSLAFALLPAISGALFKNGHAVVTDIMLLGLAGVFLHWSVTQPWVWYHAAQQVRIQREEDPDLAVEEDGDPDAAAPDHRPATTLDDVPEQGDLPKPKAQEEDPKMARRRAALRELYVHEVLALVACLVLPLASAYLLHAIRAQLSRPSGGLVSDYNLTIFLLVSELRVFSHMLKLVQSRTLHLQRVAHENELTSPSDTAARIDDVLERLETLECRGRTAQNGGSDSGRAKEEAALTRDVRNAIQPELDALNRAVRRYEKKATLLQLQTESRFTGLDARLGDAIALAAVAAKNSAGRPNIVRRAAEAAAGIILFPLNALLRLLLLPLTYLVALMHRNEHRSQHPAKTGRSSRAGKAAVQPRYGSERVATRVTRR
ncbi:hypothetical protein HRG_002225 [Hirsutella rhossiliensis]|uniref:Uncharacterized protein n=1 Tax=Hirsutella rhossiliensis TaxID=111463 RepID=A0A9P8SN50_9HYPO|nr:uncharacterized protein HRG_02225 [Hirsutella rhossiliensis]KAH0966816.1 hypothetical protein HRG_02225 [Hirsutella rhossiliensis]